MAAMMIGALLIPRENPLRHQLLLLSLVYPVFYTAHSFWCEYEARFGRA